MTAPDAEPLLAMTRLWQTPQAQACINEVEAIAGYSLSNHQRSPFLEFHRFITSEPPPRFVAHWRTEPSLEHWYHSHVNGILGHVQNGMACVYYHHDNLVALEARVGAVIERSGVRDVIRNSTIGLGNTLRLDAEYQAFVLAVRRTLDYLARGLASYFKDLSHSFREMPEKLSHRRPESVALAIADAHRRHVTKFDYVLSDGAKKSIRDLLSHYEFIGAGCVNITRQGLVLVGGGEGLGFATSGPGIALGPVMRQRVEELQACVADIIVSFVKAASEHDRHSTA